MSRHRSLAGLAAAVPALALLGVAAPAEAAPAPGAVYVLSNQASGNSVLVFARSAGGTLQLASSVATGALGTGSGLGSQGAVVLSGSGRYLYAVNAGSDSVTSFRVTPSGLARIGTVGAGSRPVSVTEHDGLVYVLDAGGAGAITGLRSTDGALSALPGSTRALSSSGVGPAQVSFTPDGSALLVAEKGTSRFDLYAVQSDGTATGPAVAASSGTTPFGFGFDNRGHAIVSEAFGGAADASAVSSYDVGSSDLTPVTASLGTTETAACWIAVTNDGRFAYAGNAGSASVTGYRVAPDGSLALLSANGKTGTASAGVTDLATSRSSRYLFGRVSDGTVAAWAIGNDGALTDLGAVAGLPAGAVGIAAS